MPNHLVIFAKEPRIGRVKTRLAKDLGKVAAWRFYRSMVQSVPRSLIGKGPWQTWLAVSPDTTKRHTFGGPPIPKRMAQGQGDLGVRMLSPSQSLPPGPFIVIGTDIPGIKAQYIRKAFKMLGRKDAVFGPSDDGGFWLVGLKRHGILKNPYRKPVRWSHEETLNDCLANLKQAKVGFVETLDDIDTVDDLRRWRENR